MVRYGVPTNNSNWVEAFGWVSSSTGGWFGVFLLLGLFIVLLVGFKRFSDSAATPVAAASFVTAITGILFSFAGLVGMREVTVCGLMVAVGVAAIYFAKD